MTDLQLAKVIYDYVDANYGEADNPSWSIEPLAKAITEKVNERQQATERLAYLREELQAERISTGELAELHDLIPFIDGSDVELLEAAGVPEDFAQRVCKTCGDLLPIGQHEHRPEITLQRGWYCDDEYYCSKPCLNASFVGQFDDDGEPLTWENHYSDDGDCYWTEWEAEV